MKKCMAIACAFLLLLFSVSAQAAETARVEIARNRIGEGYWNLARDGAVTQGTSSSYNVHLTGNTLTLNNLNLDIEENLLETEDNLDLVIIGNNTLKTTGGEGVAVYDTLTIREGKKGSVLNISATKSKGREVEAGIMAETPIMKSGRVIASGKDTYERDGQKMGSSVGVMALYNITVEGGHLEGIAKEAGAAFGVMCPDIDVVGGSLAGRSEPSAYMTAAIVGRTVDAAGSEIASSSNVYATLYDTDKVGEIGKYEVGEYQGMNFVLGGDGIPAVNALITFDGLPSRPAASTDAIPETGDETPVMLCLAMFLLASAGLAVLGMRYGRREQQK